MKPTHWTIQLLPDGGGRVRTLRVSRVAVRVAIGALGCFLVLAVGFVASLGLAARREAKLAGLERENASLERQLGRIEAQVEALGRSVDEFAVAEQRFRVLAGLPHIDPEIREVGVGGPALGDADAESFLRIAPRAAERTFAAAYDVDRLLRRAELLSTSVGEALDSMEVARAVFLARPSIRPVQSDEAWVSSSYSRSRYHPILLYNRPHHGIDIAAHAGTPILATANGTVTFAGTRAGYGKMVEIDHGFGYVTRYAHASRLTVRRGDRVERGSVIGEVGQTGLASAPNVHYEVLVDDRPVNPREYLLDDRLY